MSDFEDCSRAKPSEWERKRKRESGRFSFLCKLYLLVLLLLLIGHIHASTHLSCVNLVLVSQAGKSVLQVWGIHVRDDDDDND